jgi:hypothetical protein
MHRGNNILIKAYIGRIKGILISLSHIYIERVTRGLPIKNLLTYRQPAILNIFPLN